MKRRAREPAAHPGPAPPAQPVPAAETPVTISASFNNGYTRRGDGEGERKTKETP